VAGTTIHGEIKIPLTTLGVGKGKEIKIVQYYRYNENNAGISDLTPYNPSASPQSTSPANIVNFVSYTIRGIKLVYLTNFNTSARYDALNNRIFFDNSISIPLDRYLIKILYSFGISQLGSGTMFNVEFDF